MAASRPPEVRIILTFLMGRHPGRAGGGVAIAPVDAQRRVSGGATAQCRVRGGGAMRAPHARKVRSMALVLRPAPPAPACGGSCGVQSSGAPGGVLFVCFCRVLFSSCGSAEGRPPISCFGWGPCSDAYSRMWPRAQGRSWSRGGGAPPSQPPARRTTRARSRGTLSSRGAVNKERSSVPQLRPTSTS